MEWVETTGNTVEAATAEALDLLGIDVSDAEIEVIEKEEIGWFGRVKAHARVRARIKPRPPQTPADTRSRRGRSERDEGDSREQSRRGRSRRSSGNKPSGDSRGSSRDRQRSKKDDSRNKDESRSGGSRSNASRSRDSGSRDSGSRDSGSKESRSKDTDSRDSDANTAAAAGAAAGAAASVSKDADRNNERPGRGSRDRNEENTTNKPAQGSNRKQAKEKTMEEFPVEEQSELVREFLEGLAVLFDESATVVMTDTEDTLEASVEGDDLGLLIGPKGQTLDALDEITRTVMQREAAGRRYLRLNVDVDGYRERRREALVDFTKKLADDVKDSGIRKALEPMRSADRKVVHDTVSEIDGVMTLSEGNDPRRYVVIAPE